MELVEMKKDEIVVSENLVEMLKRYERQKIEFEMKEKQLREELLEAMEKYKIKSWQTDDGSIKAIYKEGYTRESIDSAKLKKELPDVAEEYIKTTQVKPSITLTIEV